MESTMSDEERQELLALYQVTTQDLAFFKSQQWTLLNYTLVGFAALAGIVHLEYVAATDSIKYLLCIAAFVVCGIGFWVEGHLHGSIEERRDRLERVFLKLSDAFKEARGNKPKVSAKEMLIFIRIVIVTGFLLACWVIFQQEVAQQGIFTQTAQKDAPLVKCDVGFIKTKDESWK